MYTSVNARAHTSAFTSQTHTQMHKTTHTSLCRGTDVLSPHPCKFLSLSLVSPFLSGPPLDRRTHTHTRTPPVKRLRRYSGICMPNLTHGYFMLWSSIGPHHTVVGGRPKLHSWSHTHAVLIYTVYCFGLACAVATRTESCGLPCPAVYHCTIVLRHD